MTYLFREEDKYAPLKRAFRSILYFIAGCVVTVYWLGITSLEEDEEEDNIVYLEFDCSTIDKRDNVPIQIAEECDKKMFKGKE